MYRVLIVEDTPAEADLLRALLARYSAEKDVELSATVMSSALEFIESRRVADLVLMDIDMRLFVLFDDPKPTEANDLSGFTWRSFSVLLLNICGVTL